jgi:hypothetical protein
MGKRYKVRPSDILGFDELYNNYYCFQVDMAIMVKGVLTESKAQEKALAEAKSEAAEGDDSPKAGEHYNKDNPAFNDEGQAELFKKHQIAPGSKKPAPPPMDEILKKLGDFHKKRNGE